MGRRLAIAWLGALAVALAPGCPSLPALDAGQDAGACASPDAAVPACDRPASVDPALVVDMATFRAQASAAVCDWSLRCPTWGAESFCHPEFAQLYATRNQGPAPFDLGLATTCVAQLATAVDCDAELRIANDCLAIDVGTRRTYVGEGQPCADRSCSYPPYASCPCDFDLACVGGVCARTLGPGGACDAAHVCSTGLACRGGACAFAQRGEDCSALTCAPGTVCTWPENVCETADPCSGPTMHHVGCGCSSDLDCPLDVSQCVGGVCTLRPFTGEPCTPDGAACFGSQCASGRCVPFMLGSGPCGANGDCEPGLVCGRRDLGGTGVCVQPLHLGDSCAPDVIGECVEGCCLRSVCTSVSQRGDSCNAVCPCSPELFCGSGGQCVLALHRGDACGDDPSAECVDGCCLRSVCTSASQRGDPCDRPACPCSPPELSCGPNGVCDPRCPCVPPLTCDTGSSTCI